MEIKGIIYKIGETELLGREKNFAKRILYIETLEQYPQKLAIDFLKDKTDLLDNYRIGQEVNVHINLRGNEYNDKVYISLVGWKIDIGSVSNPAKANASTNSNTADSDDDLPFN